MPMEYRSLLTGTRLNWLQTKETVSGEVAFYSLLYTPSYIHTAVMWNRNRICRSGSHLFPHCGSGSSFVLNTDHDPESHPCNVI